MTEAVEPEPEPEPEPVEPTPEEIREEAASAVEGLVPFHDELIELLEAIEEFHSDAEEKRRARSRVTMAGFSKRQDMERLREDVAAEQMFRVTGAARSVGARESAPRARDRGGPGAAETFERRWPLGRRAGRRWRKGRGKTLRAPQGPHQAAAGAFPRRFLEGMRA